MKINLKTGSWFYCKNNIQFTDNGIVCKNIDGYILTVPYNDISSIETI